MSLEEEIKVIAERMRKYPTLNSTDSKAKCPLCNGTEWIYINDGGQGRARLCKCREKEIIKGRLAFAEIPSAFQNVRLNNFELSVYQTEVGQKIIKNACAEIKYYIDNIDSLKQQGIGLYLYSDTKGSGKTRMMASIANELMYTKKYQVKFASSTAIINEIKKTWNNQTESESNLLDELSKVEVLCIDDFGIEKSATWIDERYYHIINERYINKKVTIYTSNYALKNLPYDDRITNRIEERNLQVVFPEESIRVQKAEQLKVDMINTIRCR